MKRDAAKTGSPPREVRLYLIVFLLAAGLRILFLVFIDTPILFYKYPFFAEKLAAGESIGERILDLSPLYLYLLTLLNKLFAMDWHLLKMLQAGIGALNCLLVLRLGKLVFGRDAGFLAALLCAAYGNLIVLETTLEPTVFVLLFNLLCVIFLHRSAMFPFSYRTVTAAGVFAGLAIITKPNALLILVPAALWYLRVAPLGPTYGRRIAAVCLFSATALLVVAPVTLRNYIRFNELILVTADAGKVFYHGNGKGASALEGIALADEGFAEEGAAEPDYAHVLYRKTARALEGKALSPSEASKFWVQKTLEDIRRDLTAYAVRQAKKLFYFFNDYEMHYIASAYVEYKKTLEFPFIRYGVIAALALAGMVLCVSDRKRFFLIYGIIFAYVLAGLLFLVQSRYRIPAVPYLALFAAAAVCRLYAEVSGRNWRPAGGIAVCIALFFVITHFVYRSEITHMERWQTATKHLYQMEAVALYHKKAYAEAVVKLDQCLALAPGFSPAYNLRGKAHAFAGDYDAALSDFIQVTRRSPAMAEGYKNIGFVYLLKNERKKAKVYLLRAQSLFPKDPRVEKALKDLTKDPIDE